MKTIAKLSILTILFIMITSCNNPSSKSNQKQFEYFSEQFADLNILRYQIPGFDNLSIKQKELAYYLSQAAYAGRDIIYDQNYKNNLKIKRTLEVIYKSYKGKRDCIEFEQFTEYLKRIWFSNGIHHHYSTHKFYPKFPKSYLEHLIRNCPQFDLPLSVYGSVDYLITAISQAIYNDEIDIKRVNQNPDEDNVKGSAVNYYENLTQAEVEEYYNTIRVSDDKEPISYGLNSKLIKLHGEIKERLWKIGGMYSSAIEGIVSWLNKAKTVAENPTQSAAIDKLILFYQTGDLKKFNEYCILWVKDTTSVVDFVNGFIENYGDPMGLRGAYESFVTIKDFETTKKFEVLAKDANWFEGFLPIQEIYKKKNAQGISYKVVNVIAEAGDMSPYTAIGVNLPNADWIRVKYGSKSVSLANIEEAYYESSKSDGSLQEFFQPDQAALLAQHGNLASKLHTGLHEVIGHGSGQLRAGVKTPEETLKNYSSTIEEARADLVALYFLMDEHLIDLQLVENLEVGKAEYISYIGNGLIGQLKRLKIGENIEESHMRNRQLIAKWAYEMGKQEKVIQYTNHNGKTFIVINDFDRLRHIFGKQLGEIQRIKSEGDFLAAKNLVEKYGVKVDDKLHREVLERYAKLNLAPYSGFINPVLVPIMDGDKMIDVQLEYPKSFVEQMLYYAKEFNHLPLEN